jgi:DNA-directed RNA polymerase subunit K/omega
LFISKKVVLLQHEICPIFIIYFGQNKNDIYMESTENKMETHIKKQRRGKLLFASDFALCGNTEAVFKALQRLHKSGLIMRVAHGIYYYPKINKNRYIHTKYLSPSIDEIAYGIAKRDKIRIVPTGSYALNALGLSTQVPANAVFITDGAPRRIAVGKGKGILFKHTSEARSLAYKSKLIMLIVSALREIGEGKVSEQQLEIIKSHLANVSQKELETDIQLMPLWVRKIILSL